MDKLVKVKGNDIFTDSKVIAIGTEYKHHSVTRKIRRYISDFEEFGAIKFMDTVTKNLHGGRPEKIYLLNEQQATLLMTYLENNKIVRNFKKKLVREFFQMRQALSQRSLTEWLETRKNGKLVRRNETDMLQELAEYAIKQGSNTYESKPNLIYVHYSNLVNKTVGIKKKQREYATTKTLTTIAFIEDMILNVVKEEIKRGTYYKDIYQICKAKAITIVELSYLRKEKLLIA